MNKLVLATAILVLGIAGAYFVVHNAVTPPQTAAVTSNPNTNLESNHPFVEQPSAAPSSLDQAPENLTKDFSQNLTQEIANENPSGVDASTGQSQLAVPDPNQISQQLLADAAQKLDPSILNPVVNNADLHISEDDSNKAVQTYISQFKQILVDGVNSVPLDQISDPPTLDQLPTIVTMYRNIIGKFYALTVPRVALDIHKTQLSLMIKEKNIYSAMINYQNDPVTTLLVAQELSTTEQQFSDFSQQFTTFTQKYST